MDYINQHILLPIKHSHQADFLNELALRNSIWYSATKECYAQRTTVFDNSWLMSPTSNDYILLGLKSIFEFDFMRIFDNLDDCNNEVDMLGDSTINQNVLMLYKPVKSSVFNSYTECIRNGLAHGTFNSDAGRTFIISQPRACKTSPVKFYFQIHADYSDLVRDVNSLFKRLISDSILSAKYECLEKALDLQVENGFHFSKKNGCRVIIDDEFSFSTEKHKNEIKELFARMDTSIMTVVIVSENLGSMSQKTLTSENGNIVVIPQSRIIKHFEINL